jgi:predicted DNA-binding protein
MESNVEKSKTKLITKNVCFIVRVEEEWKRKVKSISEGIGIPTSVFIRESVNKNIDSIRHL